MERVLHAAKFVGGLTVEKLRVEKGQLVAGQETGGQQSVRPGAKLVGVELEAAARLGGHRDLGPDLLPGTGGIHELHAALLRLIVEGHGIAAPLPGIETDITEGVGVSVEVVIGVIICKIGKAAHTQRVGFCQGQIDPAHQNVIRLLRGDLDEIHLRVIAVIAGVHQLLPFRGGNWLFR